MMAAGSDGSPPWPDAAAWRVFKARSVHLPELLTSESLGVAPSEQHHGAKKKEDRKKEKEQVGDSLDKEWQVALLKTPDGFLTKPCLSEATLREATAAYLGMKRIALSPHGHW